MMFDRGKQSEYYSAVEVVAGVSMVSVVGGVVITGAEVLESAVGVVVVVLLVVGPGGCANPQASPSRHAPFSQ
jgi:hypothetical protein